MLEDVFTGVYANENRRDESRPAQSRFESLERGVRFDVDSTSTILRIPTVEVNRI